MKRIALIGLGTMGTGIAGNLLKGGFELHVYNRTKEKAAALVSQGAKWAESPAAAASRAEMVIVVVGDDTASKAVWFGPEGALEGANPGTYAVECSTLSLAWVRELHSVVQAKGLKFADCQMAGSKPAAAAGTMQLYVGAEPEDFAAIQPVLGSFSRGQIHFGPPSSGATYKLINNMMAAAQVAALGEGMALAEKAGLNMDKVLQAINEGVLASMVVKMKAPNIIDRRHAEALFALRWMHKDMTYALRIGDELDVPLPVSAEVREMFRMAMQKGLGNLDWSAIGEIVRG
ncbi:MAG TPA: NAD(P)-dependent oxidoreductase [Dissulfurispiraceae bacterium]|nr:NAD(P)-dependent oxidoreductase [Dissulfurispiraceae bacterium]